MNENIAYTLSKGDIGSEERTILSLCLNLFSMPRIKQIRIIDGFIVDIETVLKDRCSLSEEDRNIFQEALDDLRFLRKKKGKTNEEILQIVKRIVKVFIQIEC
ncbi:hypothetical protein [Dyadobacter sp. CY351]|uniref:hypothetical protein n=1 Tax=Dyadobacter sp. CY351 TaxID=2909337 RepID=UPI001F19CEF7|nr:hypothetical protein [Dyadobacter sp. CY351]MCF2521077.1 hypothetical protein [Dyadobacter sp. CY351]